METEKLRLGKQDYVHDERTLQIVRYTAPEITPPSKWSFDNHRRPFPDRMWGNDNFGDCVVAARANHQLRLERVEQRRTIHLDDEDVITLYKKMTGTVEPGDANDNGLVMLDAMGQWRNEGWFSQAKDNRIYNISAYGEVDPLNPVHMRNAIYFLGGVHLGLSLPVAAQRMTDEGVWDYQGQTTPDFRPGSWGGHAVYAFGYDEESVTIKTWGMNVKVMNNFIDKYCDEAWAVVDSFDSWRTKQTLDIEKLIGDLRQVASNVTT